MMSRVSFGVAVCAFASIASAQPAERTLFVTNNESASVSSLRLNTDGTLSLIGTYPVSTRPADCALTADGRRLLVIHSNDGASGPETLSVHEVRADGSISGAVSSRLVADSPLSIGVSNTGFALVPSTIANRMDALLVGETDLTPTGSAPAGSFPFRPVASADSRFVYCAGSISPDDVVTFSLSATGQLSRLSAIDIPNAAAFGVALHPSGTMLYVSTGQANTIRWYNVNTTTGALSFGGSMTPGGNSVTELAVTPDGKWLYAIHVLSDTLNVVRINADGSLSPTIFSYFLTSDARDVVTDGRFVYATDETLIGGYSGVYAFRINQSDGSLTQLALPQGTDGFLPQFMALWSPAICLGDADVSGEVSFGDITEVLEHFGSAGPAGDADQDGDVDFSDLTSVLENFGPCGA